MKIILHGSTIALTLTVLLISGGPSFPFTAMGDNVGLVAATVETGDNERGLTVRADPSNTSQAMGYLPVGTELRSNGEFKNGYMQVVSPVEGVWVKMAHLKPLGGEGTVTSVDQPQQCLRIRQGPGTGFDMVGCAELASKLALTGVWTTDNWAQIEGPVQGWVYAKQIRSDLKPAKIQTTKSTPAPRRQVQSVESSESTSYWDDPDLWHDPPKRRWRRHWDDDYYYRGPYGGPGLYFHKKWGGKKNKK